MIFKKNLYKFVVATANNIKNYVKQNSDVLDVIRVWDWEAAFAKLKPEIGLIPYVDFEDNDFSPTIIFAAFIRFSSIVILPI